MSMNIFLQLDGIPGESNDARHRDQIELHAWSWGVNNNMTSSGAGGGAGVGKAQFSSFVFTHRYDKASPKLMLACAKGAHIPKAVLRESRAGGTPGEFLQISLEDVLVTAVLPSDPGQGPMENVTLIANKLRVEYRPQKPDGSHDAPITATWDVLQNKEL